MTHWTFLHVACWTACVTGRRANTKVRLYNMSPEPPLPLVTLYSKPDCHLCDIAKERLANVRKRIPFDLETVDITADPDLFETYKERIPVIFVNGEETAVYRVSERRLTRKLRACSPRTSLWSHLRRKPT